MFLFIVCDENSKFTDYLTIPADVNMTEVKDLICSANFTVIIAEIMDRFNIPEILAIVHSNSTVQADWTKVGFYTVEIDYLGSKAKL